VPELRIETGSSDPALVAIGDRPIVLGRSSDVDLQIPDQRLSRHHCRVELAGGKLIVTDLGSSNGTFARGQRISKVALDSGEAFYVGKTRIVYSAVGTGGGSGMRAAVGPVAVPIGAGGSGTASQPHVPAPAPAPAARAPAPSPAYGQASSSPSARSGGASSGAYASPGGASSQPTPATFRQGPPPTAAIPRDQVLGAPALPHGASPPPRDTHQSDPSPIEGYQIFDKLGEGSMGTVYTARSLETGQDCVLKTVKFDGSPKDAIFFIRECQMGVKLRHPNIVSVIDFGEAGGILFLAMEYLNGGSLLDRIKRSGPLGNREALSHLIQLADAIGYASRKKFVHRDIKPANVLLTPDGSPKLADFGLAKMMAQQSDMALTKIGETRGTPIYMPPELLTNAADADTRADIYSLGATYYHALTGFHPFRANSVVEILRMVMEQEPQRILERNPSVHPELADIVENMMRKRKEDRYQNAEELATELNAIAPVIPEDE
jgi:pSer/pThr/pTyr-binding forkhead associated (FHA) protein